MKLREILSTFGLSIAILSIAACSTTQETENVTVSNSSAKAGNSTAQEASSQVEKKYEDKDLRTIASYKLNPKVSNAAPSTSFDQYGNFEIADVVLSSPNRSSNGAKRARVMMKTELAISLEPLFETWQKEGATLIIKPEIIKLKLISGTTRFWVGAWAGGSNVTLKLSLIDKASGQEVGSPIFYRKSNAFGAAWSQGATDRDIFRRTAKLISFYFQENYNEAVATPSGRE